MRNTFMAQVLTVDELELEGLVDAITDAELELLVAGTSKIGGFEF